MKADMRRNKAVTEQKQKEEHVGGRRNGCRCTHDEKPDEGGWYLE
jgi:hypothetical protein